jgi:hypothetical protein
MKNKIGYYKHIYFYIIHHENKLGYYEHRYFFLSYFIKITKNNQYTQSHYKLLKIQLS